MLIPASRTLIDIGSDASIRELYPLFALACEVETLASTPGVTTLAGSLCQTPHADGDARRLAILEGDAAALAHQSDIGTTLVALDAVFDLEGDAGSRAVPASEFFTLPREGSASATVLAAGEWLTGVRLPAAAAGGVQRYTRLAADGPVPFSVVSLAAARRTDGEVRLVLGGVSPRPYRVYNSIEEETMAGGLDDDSIAGLAERALLDAEPAEGSIVKVEAAALLLRDAIRELAVD